MRSRKHHRPVKPSYICRAVSGNVLYRHLIIIVVIREQPSNIIDDQASRNDHQGGQHSGHDDRGERNDGNGGKTRGNGTGEGVALTERALGNALLEVVILKITKSE